MGIKLRLDGVSPYQKSTDLFRELVSVFGNDYDYEQGRCGRRSGRDAIRAVENGSGFLKFR
jgi:hypothetical protein